MEPRTLLLAPCCLWPSAQSLGLNWATKSPRSPASGGDERGEGWTSIVPRRYS